MKHFVLFFKSSGPRHTCAATFPSRKAAEDFAKEWKIPHFAVGEVVRILGHRKMKVSKSTQPARKLLAAPKSI